MNQTAKRTLLGGGAVALIGGAVLLLNPGTDARGKRIMLPQQAGGGIYILDVKKALNPQPGDTLVIPSKISAPNVMLNGFSGTAERPIVIIQEDPSKSIGGYKGYGVSINQARYFKVVGLNVDAKNQTPGYAFAIGNGTSDYTIEDVSVRNSGSGMVLKWNPEAGKPETAAPNTINNVVLRRIRVTNVGAEGIYAGHTGTGLPEGMKPAAIVNILLEDIVTDSTGWDGIQVTGARNITARNLKVTNYGLKNTFGQNSGVTLGGSTTVNEIKDVRIAEGSGSGFSIFGRGDMRISNVTMTNVAKNGTDALYVDDYPHDSLPALRLILSDWTINGAGRDAIRIVNKNKAMRPGVFTNIVFSGTKGAIYDASRSELLGGTLGKAPTEPEVPVIKPVTVLKEVTLQIMSDSSVRVKQ